LEDGRALSEYNITNESMLYMVHSRQVLQISAKTLTGKLIPIEAEASDTVFRLKEKLCEAEGISVEQQRLVFAGKELEDWSTLSLNRIHNHSTVFLLVRPQSSSSSSSPPVVSSQFVGARGLFNLGNTCYMNSTLQALSAIVPLRKYYRSGDFKADISTAPLSMDGRLATSFANLLNLMWENACSALSPVDIKKLVAERRPEFGGSQQHDAQEMLMLLLDGLHEDVNRAPCPRPTVEDPTMDGKTEVQIAEEAWCGNLRRNRSRIVDIFQFQVRSEIAFPDVGMRSLKFDPMMYLSLPIPTRDRATSSSVDLEECLRAFSTREELSHEDWARCEQTGEVERTTKKLDIWSAPEVLIVHLKRFGADVGQMRKVETLVQAPMKLDLAPWIQGPVKSSARYMLTSVVNHSGSLGFGHYTAYGLVGEGTRRWHFFNDSSVCCASESDVVSKAAYILFYERSHETM